jgi:hypothetical protein
MKNLTIKIFTILFLLFTATLIYSEDINFFTRSTFSNSQFWESQSFNDDPNFERNVFTNFFSGSTGFGMEFIIWDNGKARGSRIFFKTGLDLLFSGFSYAGAYDVVNVDHGMASLNINGGAFYSGLDWDFFVGGTFPRTDLIWGFGCIWNFMFPSYSPVYNVNSFVENYQFYAVPAVLLGYDIIIPKTKFKITPQIRAGFTCNSVTPGDLIRDMGTHGGSYIKHVMYSGPYIDFSVAFSFASVKWKD